MNEDKYADYIGKLAYWTVWHYAGIMPPKHISDEITYQPYMVRACGTILRVSPDGHCTVREADTHQYRALRSGQWSLQR